MNLSVNGEAHEIESGPLTTLLDVLREELSIVSPKASCEEGGCGACTVLIDGEPRRACLTAVGMLDGAEVTTVDGIGSPDELAPLQQAFTHHYAVAVRLLHAGDADGRARRTSRRAAPTIAPRSRRRSSGTSAAARATSRSSTRSPPSRAATRST